MKLKDGLWESLAMQGIGRSAERVSGPEAPSTPAARLPPFPMPIL